MRFGSLFAGIGGIDLGLERAGMECAWQVENDAYCTKVLAKHWPNVKRYQDIREVDFGRVERVDLICGGFPCQDLSYAGKGAGLSGERSGLWTHFKHAICDLRPTYVLVENVSGLLSRGMGVVLGDLSSLGYDAEWESIPAAAFGAPHLRWRVFIVAYAQRPERRQSESLGYVSNGADAGWPQETGGPRASGSYDRAWNVADTSSERRQIRTKSNVFPTEPRFQRRNGKYVAFPGWADKWAIEPPVGRVVDGLPGTVDRLRGLGNAVVPQKAEYLGRLILEHAGAAA